MLIISDIKVNIIYDKKKKRGRILHHFKFLKCFVFQNSSCIFPGWGERNSVLLQHPVFTQCTCRREQVAGGWTERNCTFETFEWFLMQYITSAWGVVFFSSPPLHHCTSVFLPHFPPLGFRQMFGRSAPKSPNFPRSHAEAARPLFFPAEPLRFRNFRRLKMTQKCNSGEVTLR